MIKSKLLLILFLCIGLTSIAQKQWTLKECVEHALEKNITIQQNILSIEIAKENEQIAKGNFLPNLNASTGGNFNFGTSFDPRTNDRISTSLFGGSMNIGSGATVFNGFINTNTYKQAKLGVESSILDLKVMENDVSLRVVNGYLNILFAKENLAAAKVQAEISAKQIEAAEKNFEAGSIPKGDLLNIKSTAATDAQTVVARENDLNIALLNLAQLILVPVENFDIASVDVGTPSSVLLYNSSDVVYQKSLTTQPQIERASLAIKNEELNIELTKGSFLPTLSLNAGIFTNYGFNLNLPPGFSNQSFGTQLSDNLGYGVGFNINIPIFNRFQTKNRLERAKINKEVRELAYENEKLTLQQTIEQAYLDVKAALKTYEAAKVSLASQEEAYKNAQESFNYGAMTLFDFELIRIRLVNAEAAMIRAKYDYVFRTKVLQFFSGELIFD